MLEAENRLKALESSRLEGGNESAAPVSSGASDSHDVADLKRRMDDLESHLKSLDSKLKEQPMATQVKEVPAGSSSNGASLDDLRAALDAAQKAQSTADDALELAR